MLNLKKQSPFIFGMFIALGCFLDTLGIYLTDDFYYLLSYVPKLVLLVIYISTTKGENVFTLLENDHCQEDVDRFLLCACFPSLIFLPMLINMSMEENAFYLLLFYTASFLQVVGSAFFTLSNKSHLFFYYMIHDSSGCFRIRKPCLFCNFIT